MFRYLVAIWDEGSTPSGAAAGTLQQLTRPAPGWTTGIEEPGLFARYATHPCCFDGAMRIGASFGVILGTMYPARTQSHSKSPSVVRELPDEQSEAIIQSRGRHLISHFWGSYVLLLREPSTRSVYVLRGPMSRLPCFQVRVGNVTILFSFVDDYLSLSSIRPTINWDALGAQMTFGDYLSNETCLNEMKSVECGECVRYCRNEQRTTAYWLPVTYQEDAHHAPFLEATHSLRETTQFCVDACASSHKVVLQALSGGLDSSIVLSCLSRSIDRLGLNAVTYFSRGSGDERAFARSMAKRVGCRLYELARNDNLDLRVFTNCIRTVRPVLHFTAPDSASRNTAIARECGASIIVDGGLGDNVFGSNVDPGMLVECYRQRGVSMELLTATLNYAKLTRQSLWQVARAALVDGTRNVRNFSVFEATRRRHKCDYASTMTLVSTECLDRYVRMQNRFVHPWLCNSRAAAPGSLGLLIGLIVVTSACYHSAFARPDEPARESPLACQPLVEWALRTPGYLHVYGAQNRAVARSAFTDVLPESVIARGTAKGGPELWLKDVINKNLVFLREFLLDGQLVKARLIDRRRLETVLSSQMITSEVVVADIFSKLYMEAWLHQWNLVGVR
jgi:asparagine synthase (glutamine-hydrolysing)